MTLPVVFTANGPSGYNLTKSLRLRSSASAYLNRTISSNGSATTWTYSTWVKRGTLGTAQDCFLEARVDGNNNTESRFSSDDTIELLSYNGGVGVYSLKTSQVFRDPSAWYHIVIAVDTTQATSSNRVKLYVNGTQVTAFSTATYPSQNASTYISQTSATHNIGRWPSPTQYFDGYMAEVNFIDGQALAPTSFGSTNSLTGVWQPAKYTGTYGTNGFYLPFTDITSTTTLGYDFSGNSNNWTTNNLSLTTGSTYDSMTDVPTLTSATTANYCVVNPLDKGATATVSNGNLRLNNAFTGSPYPSARCSLAVSSGKYYWEITCTTISGDSPSVGIATSQASVNNYLGVDAYSWVYVLATGNKGNNGNTAQSYGASVASGDIVGVALDMDAGTITFYKNGTSQGVAFTGLTGTMFPAGFAFNNSVLDFNFGQQSFTYTPPTGFVALNTYNLPTSTIVNGGKCMDATIYTGDGSQTKSFTNTFGFKPDLVWSKIRSGTTQGTGVFDSVRGTTGQSLDTASTSAEGTWNGALSSEYGYVSAFNSNGFSVDDGSVATTGGYVNYSGRTYVAWQWQAGQGTTSSNTSGSITSTVSVNASAGFSVVKWTGTGSVGTIGHGLGVAPKMIIGKRTDGISNWFVYHTSLGATAGMNINTTDAALTNSGWWNNTAPTSSVFTIGSFETNSGSPFIAYCWSEIAGFSKFGSYTGNNSADGPFVYLGFSPKFVMIKCSTSAEPWLIIDCVRQTYDVLGPYLIPNASDAEGTYPFIDFTSNGFKLRNTGGSFNNAGGTYIYMAFASNPFKNSNAF